MNIEYFFWIIFDIWIFIIVKIKSSVNRCSNSTTMYLAAVLMFNWKCVYIYIYIYIYIYPNLIYVVICSGCNKKYIGQTGGQLKKRLSIYRQYIRQPEYEKIEVEWHLRTCGKGIFKIFPFFKMKENNKILRECYEDHFIKKFKPELNRRL